MRRWVLLLMVLSVLGSLALAGCSANPTKVPAGTGKDDQGVSAPTRPAGAEVFAENCARCHGDEGQGAIGPKIRPPRLSEDNVFAVIADGREGTQMRPFRGVLAEESVDSVIDYLFGR